MISCTCNRALNLVRK